MISQPPTTLTSFSVVTPLGIRFWDRVTGTVVGNGLEVAAYPPNDPTRQSAGFATQSGAYTLRDLPGLHALEAGAGDADYWQNLPKNLPAFRIAVRDSLGRFLPFSFDTFAPLRRLLRWVCKPDTPAGGLVAVPLFSAATRVVPLGMAVVRAQLRDTETKQPAAWAVIEARVKDNVVALGMSDTAGSLALLFAYPRQPTSGSRPELRDQTWSLQLRARYRRGAPTPDGPDLCATLRQPTARLWRDEDQRQELTDETLTYGQALVLRTRIDDKHQLPELLITQG